MAEAPRDRKPGTKPSRRTFLKSVGIIGIAATGAAVFLEKCTRLTEGIINPKLIDAIDQGFRLFDHHSLLNLEFYFINCQYNQHKNKMTAKYGPHENYMIVRLPQQHIAETSFHEADLPPGKPIQAVSYISGYSYLVFRILFPKDPIFAFKDGTHSRLQTLEDGEYTDIHITPEGLLDWNDDRKFRLVVRQDLTESIFETKKAEYYRRPLTDEKEKPQDSVWAANEIENSYPFQQIPVDTTRLADIHAPDHQHYLDSLTNDSLRINKLPMVYGDPVTALEIPWRLIISPALPDSQKFKFDWDIVPVAAAGPRHTLWTATLSVTERTDLDYLARKADEEKSAKDNKDEGAATLNETISQLELMILGSPDYKGPEPGNIPAAGGKLDAVLPKPWHRHDLVALYIQLKVLARTDRLVFSPLGATTHIHLKNDKIEKALKKHISVIEWDQVISLGRDEKVEVSTLFLEAEFGHKMVYIETAQRQLKAGVYVLIRKEYIMPLDIVKDYTNHITQENPASDGKGPSEITSRFNSPFKKISFLETKPKLLLPPGKFYQDAPTHTETIFEFEAIDWHGNNIKFQKKINALPFGFVIDRTPGKTSPDVINISKQNQNDIPLPTAQTDTVIFQSTANIDAQEKLTDKSAVVVAQLDASFKDQRALDKHFFDSIGTLFINSDTAELDNIREKLNEFIELYKNKAATLQNDLSKLDKPDGPYIFKTLMEKYLLKDQVLDKNFKAVIDNWIQNEVRAFNDVLTFKERMLSGLQQTNPALYSYLDSQFAPLGSTIKAKIEEFRIASSDAVTTQNNQLFIQIGKYVTTWAAAAGNAFLNDAYLSGFIDDFKTFVDNVSKAQETLVNAKTLMVAILKNSPAFVQLFSELSAIKNSPLGADKDIVSTIQQSIQKAAEIEGLTKEIPNIILLARQKIGYAIKQTVDPQKEKEIRDATGEVKKSLSELESEYIIFKGCLRHIEDGSFDFFHDYAIIPGVTQAKVYISTLNRLLNDDIPISINYAREYLQNQAKDIEFEVKQNASMVFAEVQQFSRDQVSGLIKKIGEHMPGFNVEIPVQYLTYLQNPRAAQTDLLKQIGYSAEDSALAATASRDLVFISDEVKDSVKTLEDLNQIDPKKYFRNLGAKLFGSIGLEEILDIGFDLPRTTELPDKIIYQFSTESFRESKLAFVAFKPSADANLARTRLDLFISKSLRKANEFYSYTQLNNFSVSVVLGGTEVLTVFFENYKVTSSPAQPKKTDISISNVKLGGALEFIAEIAKKIQAPGNGLQIKPGPRKLEVFYGIGFPNITAPAFNLKNLQLNLGVSIPYDPGTVRPISFIFGLNSPSNKFLVSAGTYGGRGHFLLRATPKGIEQIDVAIELGAYGTLNLGIGQGEVFLFFGLWFVTGQDPDTGENMMKVVAYVLCCGSAVVLGFITIGVSVLISLTYIKRGQLSLVFGEAVVTYSVKIAFFKKEFTVRYYKELAGSGQGNNTTGTNVQQSSILGGIFGGSEKKKKKDWEENTEFDDVFTTSDLLDNYISCFH